jgi:hypothetical protein
LEEAGPRKMGQRHCQRKGKRGVSRRRRKKKEVARQAWRGSRAALCGPECWVQEAGPSSGAQGGPAGFRLRDGTLPRSLGSPAVKSLEEQAKSL